MRRRAIRLGGTCTILLGLTLRLHGQAIVGGFDDRSSFLYQFTVGSARERGLKEAGYHMLRGDGEMGPSVDDLFRESRVLVAKAMRISVATTARQWIHTWHVFQVEQVLAQGTRPDTCPVRLAIPPSLNLADGEIAFATGGGTTMVDDVNVTVAVTQEIELRANQRYLVVGTECGDRVMLTGGRFGLWTVGADDTISASAEQQWEVRATKALMPSRVMPPEVVTSVAAVRAYLARAPR